MLCLWNVNSNHHVYESLSLNLNLNHLSTPLRCILLSFHVISLGEIYMSVYFQHKGRWDCVVGIVASLQARKPRVRIPPKHPEWLGANPGPYSMGIRNSCPREETAGHKLDHLPLPSTEVRTEWSYTSAVHICLYDMHSGTFNFTSTITQYTPFSFFFIFKSL
jgi:hypothetical protein